MGAGNTSSDVPLCHVMSELFRPCKSVELQELSPKDIGLFLLSGKQILRELSHKDQGFAVLVQTTCASCGLVAVV